LLHDIFFFVVVVVDWLILVDSFVVVGA
jgi:hypothetical protein